MRTQTTAATSPRKRATAPDAIALLKEDHKTVSDLFEQFEKLGDRAHAAKQKLVRKICAELKVHTQIEEEIFYPPVRAALGDEEDLMNEAQVEHDGAKGLIQQIQAGSASDPMTCARFLVLSEQIDHHVKEEREEMFPKARKTDLDLVALGRELQARKEELEGRIGNPPLPYGKASLLERLTLRRA
jgi:hemerythrin-like domain-containing protein